jgi:hypothetical protein
MSTRRLILALAVAVGAPAHGRFRGGGGGRSSSFEPSGPAAPIRTDGCPWENDPVECRSFPPGATASRVYSSICFASRAGYEIEHCRTRRRTRRMSDDASTPAEREPEPEPSLRCLSVTDVACKAGDSEPKKKKFANLCLAQVSGYRATDCAAVATEQRRLQWDEEEVFCPMWYRPVYCTLQGIHFSSDCEAGVAGHSLHDCTLPEGDDAACPPAGQGAVGPVRCNGTTYSTLCLASAANHTPATDCSLADNDATVETKSSSSSSTTTARKCSKSGKVACGRRGRAFDNMCLARKAGFPRKECQSI